MVNRAVVEIHENCRKFSWSTWKLQVDQKPNFKLTKNQPKFSKFVSKVKNREFFNFFDRFGTL